MSVQKQSSFGPSVVVTCIYKSWHFASFKWWSPQR